jgi:hypothetical protein
MSYEEIAGASGDVPASNLVSGSSSDLRSRVEPISHGVGVSLLLADGLDVYGALRDLWRERVDEPGKTIDLVEDYAPSFLPGDDYVLRFKSSRWKAGMEKSGTWRRWYKYHLQLRRVETDEDGERVYRKPPTSLNLVIEPQVEGLTYKDGNDVRLPYGEGTRVSIQTTFCERGPETVNRLLGALTEAVGPDVVDAGTMKRDSVRIWKAEAHVRFDIDEKHAVKKTLDKSEDLVDVGGGSEIDVDKRRESEGWLEASVVSDRFDRLGFDETDYSEGLKVYQASKWYDKPRSDPFHHPKLEAYLAGSPGQSPHISEFDEVLDRLRALVCSHLEWAGVPDSALVPDDYFKPAIQPRFEWSHPEGRREDLKAFYNRFETVIYGECLKANTCAVFDILCVVNERYGATYDTLEAETGYSRSNIQYHVSRLVEQGLLRTIGNPAIVCYDADYLYDLADDVVEQIGTDAFDEETLARRRLGREDRAEERREARERRQDPDDGLDDEPAEAGDDVEQEKRDRWVYLKDWYGTPKMLVDEIVDGERSERDVRLRVLDSGG